MGQGSALSAFWMVYNWKLLLEKYLSKAANRCRCYHHCLSLKKGQLLLEQSEGRQYLLSQNLTPVCFCWRFYKRVEFKENCAMVCKKSRLFYSIDNTSVTLVWSGVLVMTRSRIFLPHVGLRFNCVKKWSFSESTNNSFVPEAQSGASQGIFAKLKSPQITIFSNLSQSKSRKLLNKAVHFASNSGR